MSALILRPLQEKTMEALRDSFLSGHRAVMLYGPTGFGKTELAISLMQATAVNGKRAAMVLDRRILCEQTSLRLEKYGIDHGVLQSGHWRYRPHEKIQVCSAQTLEKRGSFPGLNLMIVDEAHAQRQQTIEFIKSNPHIRVIGLSASPFTKGLGGVYSTVVSSATTKELVERGELAGLNVFVARAIDMTGAQKVAGEWSHKEATERGIKVTGDIVSEWVKMTHDVFGGPRKTIVFCAGVAHGADLAQKFADDRLRPFGYASAHGGKPKITRERKAACAAQGGTKGRSHHPAIQVRTARLPGRQGIPRSYRVGLLPG